jgi:hypothetical protein
MEIEIRRASRERYFAEVREQSPAAFDRLMAKVAVGHPADCWPWTGGRFRDGYGRVSAGPRNDAAHRIAHRFFHGEAGPLEVRHSCHNPRCVNPGHLRAGTHRDNMQDRKAAGRGGDLRGVKNGRAMLTDDQVREIFASEESGAALATMFRVSKVTTCGIRRGVKWKHLTSGG